jgi:predicted ATPase
VTVPAVAQLLREGLELPAGATVLVGENGSGKSTVLEVLVRRSGSTPRRLRQHPPRDAAQ